MQAIYPVLCCSPEIRQVCTKPLSSLSTKAKRSHGGDLNYAHAVGVRSLEKHSSNPSMTIDTTMRIASSTKLVTSIAAVQCVQRGLLHLDDAVIKVLPELKDLEILTDFQRDGNPRQRTRSEPLTLK